MSGLVLALDASHLKGSVSVTKGAEPLCEIIFDASDTHSATLMPAVEQCLKTARASIGDIDLFVTVIGPGSFTGLRIGLATVKGFAAVKRRPVAAVGSLELLAAAVPLASPVVAPMIDARRGEVYAALYSTFEGRPAELVAPFASAPGYVGSLLAERFPGSAAVVCGTGSERYRGEIEEHFRGEVSFLGPRWSVPSASLAAAMALEREPVPYGELSRLEPMYIRPPDAKLPSATKLRPGGSR